MVVASQPALSLLANACSPMSFPLAAIFSSMTSARSSAAANKLASLSFRPRLVGGGPPMKMSSASSFGDLLRRFDADVNSANSSSLSSEKLQTFKQVL